MQVCTSLRTDNHASTSPLSFFTGRMPFLPPNQQRQSTEGKNNNKKTARRTAVGQVTAARPAASVCSFGRAETYVDSLPSSPWLLSSPSRPSAVHTSLGPAFTTELLAQSQNWLLIAAYMITAYQPAIARVRHSEGKLTVS